MSSIIKNEIARIAGVVNDNFMANEYLTLESKIKGCMTGINFLWGHPLEIVQTLALYTKHDSKKFEKFPLIALYTDIKIQRNKYGDYDGCMLELIIANATSPNYLSPERENKNFIPILRPCYNYFIAELENSTVFNVENPLTDLKHDAIERYFWGKTGLYGNVGNVFNDFVDAIQIQNLDLKLNMPC